MTMVWPYSACRHLAAWMIFTVSAMHVSQVLLMEFDRAAIHATNLTSAMMVLRYFSSDADILTLKVAMLVCVIMALIGVLGRIGWSRILYLVPQHLLIGSMAFGGLWAATQGHYLDGTVVSGAHIMADQIGYIVIFILHTLSVLVRCWTRDG